MGAKFRSWWQKVRKPQEIAPIAALLMGLVTVIFLVIAGYRFHWDWLQLLVIPFVLAVGSYLFIYTASRNGQKAMQLRNQTERDIASDNQHETALQDYIDKLSELLLHEKLRESAPEDEVRKIARARTLTVLPRLDKERKRSVLQFLHESGLIDKDKRIIDLRGADLSGANLIAAYLNEADLSRAILSEADLSGAYLDEANLGGAYLRGAILRGAYLHGANLSGADLSEADLNEAYLSEAYLNGATITPEQLDKAKSLIGAVMPGGLKHP